MIHHVVFDMSNTLVPFESKVMMRRAGVMEEDYELFRMEVVHSSDWYALDRGVITEEQAIARLCENLPARLHQSVRYFLSHLFEGSEPFPEMYELVRDCRDAGYGTYLLSNATTRFPQIKKLVPAVSLMDGIFISCEVGLLKPDPAIYRLFFEKFGLAPESCFFIDDMEANVEAAAYCGMPGFVFRREYARLRAAMRRAGMRI